MRAFLGLGSNLGDREALLRGAVDQLPDVVAVSPMYETDPVGGPDQGAFLNLVLSGLATTQHECYVVLSTFVIWNAPRMALISAKARHLPVAAVA